MGFWNNVEQERVFQGISRKDLAYKANISYASIGLGLERNSMPGADTALRVSKVLRVPPNSCRYKIYIIDEVSSVTMHPPYLRDISIRIAL